MEGETFRSLSKLQIVLLSDNDCINEKFEGETQIARLVATVTEKCATNYPEIVQALRTSLSTMKQEKSTCTANLARSEEVNKESLRTISTKSAENSNLQVQMQKLNEKFANYTEMTETLQASVRRITQEKLACAAKLAESEAVNTESPKTFDLKMTEMSELREQVQVKNYDITQNIQKIKSLEDKIKLLSRNENMF